MDIMDKKNNDSWAGSQWKLISCTNIVTDDMIIVRWWKNPLRNNHREYVQ